MTSAALFSARASVMQRLVDILTVNVRYWKIRNAKND
jgi:hypothetical protein